jgi:2-methylisocitrate lyase-like PEP mutase family enzyme
MKESNMTTQVEKAKLLTDLHIKGDPLILSNIWDAGSALVVVGTGAKAIATSSWSVAAAHGYDNGEKLPFDLVLANLKRIVDRVDLPVTIDLEGGYGHSPAEVQENVRKVIEAGAVGINFEDQIVDGDGLFSIEDQCARIKAIGKAANDFGVPIFINARTDIFMQTDPRKHEHHLEQAIGRAVAYANSGANGFFVPGLADARHIEKLCELSPLPINIMMMSNTPSLRPLADLGVARISYGPIPYQLAMNALKEAGLKACLMD